MSGRHLADELLHPRWHRLADESIGLVAFVVIDDTTLGPAAGGVRTFPYADEAVALADARALARAMTYKCALAGLPAGGGKAVVIERPDLDRERAFERLGAFIEELDGELLTAGDLGTRSDDLRAMARYTRHVYVDEARLSAAIGRGCIRAAASCVAFHNGSGSTEISALRGMSIAVQGCGMVGTAVARAAAATGARVAVADLIAARAEALATAVGATLVSPEEILELEVDVLAPCAAAGVVTAEVAHNMRAWGLCGAANNLVASDDAAVVLHERGVVHVPDILASAGAVIEGVGHEILGLEDCSPWIDGIGDTVSVILERARAADRPTSEIARELGRERIAAARS